MRVLHVNPILNVSDIADTIGWLAKLGWTVGFEWQDDPEDPNSPVEITHPPTKEPWGVCEMHVRHPDGHVFRISTRSF